MGMSRAEDVLNWTAIDRSQRSSPSPATIHAFKVHPLLPPVYVSSPVTAGRPPVYTPRGLGEVLGIYAISSTAGNPFIHEPSPRRKVSPMSSSNPTALQRLRRLDRSSPNFHNQLSNVLFGEEYGRSVPNLRGNDLVSLVDYLNKVCRPMSLLRPQLKRVQAPDILDFVGQAFQKCLRELGNICGSRVIPPTSYTLSSSLLIYRSPPCHLGGSW